MANQFTSEAAELVKALTGIETLSGAAVAGYLLVSLLTFLGTRRGALEKYVAARPRLAKLVTFLQVFAVTWTKADDAKSAKK